MQIVTGYRGGPHITSNDEQGRNQGVFGTSNYILDVGNKFAPSIVTANEVKIADGEGIFQGVHFRVNPGTYDNITIENGAQGKKRKDLIVARYTRDTTTGVENIEWAVIKGTATTGTPARPSHTTGNILGGATLAEMPMVEVYINGLAITSVTRIPPVISNMAALKNVLDALPIEIVNNITGITFDCQYASVANDRLLTINTDLKSGLTPYSKLSLIFSTVGITLDGLKRSDSTWVNIWRL